MMLVSEEIFEKFESFIKNMHFEVHAVYEPDGSKIYGDCYLAAVDLFQEGTTYKVWFKLSEDGTPCVEHVERWWFG